MCPDSHSQVWFLYNCIKGFPKFLPVISKGGISEVNVLKTYKISFTGKLKCQSKNLLSKSCHICFTRKYGISLWSPHWKTKLPFQQEAQGQPLWRVLKRWPITNSNGYPSLVTHAYNSNTQETKAGALLEVPDQPGLQNKTQKPKQQQPTNLTLWIMKMPLGHPFRSTHTNTYSTWVPPPQKFEANRKSIFWGKLHFC